MMEVLKELFLPKTVVGLQVGRHSVRAVQVSNPSRSPVIDRMAVQDLEDPVNCCEVETWMRERKMSPEFVITALPSSAASIREISIAFDSPKKLGRIIKYQMEPLVPYPVEEMIVDYLPAESGESVTAIGVRKETVSGCIEGLRQSKIEPGVVSLDGLALYGLYLRLHGGENPGVVSIIHKEGDETLVMIIHGNRLAMVRLLQGGQPPEIRETLALYKIKDPEGRVESILLTGAGADESLCEDLRREVGIEVTLWRPFDRCRHELGEIDTKTQMLFAVPLGLALGSFAPPLRRFNLRREEFAPLASANLKRPLVYMAASLLVLLTLVTFTTYHSLHRSEKEYMALRSEVHSVFRTAFPDVPNILKGMELEQMKQKILEGRREYLWLEGLTDRGPALEVLLMLTRDLSGFRDVKLDNVSIEGKRVDLDGRASSFQGVDSMKSGLERSGFFTQVKLVGAKMDNKDKMVRFNFVMERQS